MMPLKSMIIVALTLMHNLACAIRVQPSSDLGGQGATESARGRHVAVAAAEVEEPNADGQTRRPTENDQKTAFEKLLSPEAEATFDNRMRNLRRQRVAVAAAEVEEPNADGQTRRPTENDQKTAFEKLLSPEAEATFDNRMRNLRRQRVAVAAAEVEEPNPYMQMRRSTEKDQKTASEELRSSEAEATLNNRLPNPRPPSNSEGQQLASSAAESSVDKRLLRLSTKDSSNGTFSTWLSQQFTPRDLKKDPPKAGEKFRLTESVFPQESCSNTHVLHFELQKNVVVTATGPPCGRRLPITYSRLADNEVVVQMRYLKEAGWLAWLDE